MERRFRISSRSLAQSSRRSCCAASPARADEGAGASYGTSAPAAIVLARISTDPRTPDGYSADVELHVKLHSFPFIGITVHGSSSYRKPGFYHFQLQNLPRIASKFDDLRYDLGDPLAWSEKYDVAIAPASTDDAPVLRLTPKKAGGLVTSLDIETDPKYGRLLKATWKRHDGGTIVLTQTYAALGAGDVVTQQHATIDIPHMRAEVTATYRNVTLDTPMVAGVPER